MNFDRVLAQQLWAEATSAATAYQRGKLLELTVAYFFVTHGGFDVRLRLTGLDSEFDLLLRSRDPDARVHRELGSYILVECKNTDTRTSASKVRNFSAKVRYAGCRSGVLVSRTGLTGTRPDSVGYAAYAVRKAYHRDGSIIVLMDGDDIQEVIDGSLGFLDLLERRYEEIRFDLRTS
jgi:hypothetical protein